MEKLSNNELKTINGGSNTLWYILGGLGLLIVGIIDGFKNPIKCHNS